MGRRPGIAVLENRCERAALSCLVCSDRASEASGIKYAAAVDHVGSCIMRQERDQEGSDILYVGLLLLAGGLLYRDPDRTKEDLLFKVL